MKCSGSGPETSLFTAEYNVCLVQCSKWHRETEQKNGQLTVKANGFVQTSTWHEVNRTASPCAEMVDRLNYFTEINTCSTTNTEQSNSSPQVIPAEAGTCNLLIWKCMRTHNNCIENIHFFFLKVQFTKNIPAHNLLAFILFQACMICFLLWNIKKEAFSTISKLTLDVPVQWKLMRIKPQKAQKEV